MAVVPKNKKITILLLITVLLIWGIIAYKVIITITNKTVHPVPERKLKDYSAIRSTDYSLTIVERDPFLSILTDTAPNVIIPDTPIKKYSPPIKKKHTPVVYCGMIKNTENTIAIFKVGNDYHFLEQGHKDSILKVININNENVTVIYHGERMKLALTEN